MNLKKTLKKLDFKFILFYKLEAFMLEKIKK